MRGLTVGIALAGVGCATNPQPAVGLQATYDTWDADRDGVLNDDEFAARWRTTFDGWDTNDDARVSAAEFGTGVGDDTAEFGAFGTWDANRDGLLDDGEFIDGSFGVFDDDDDGVIDDDEWEAGFELW